MNEIDAQTAANVKTQLRESDVSSPIEIVVSVATVCAPMQVDVKVTNTGDLEFTKENTDQVLEEIMPYFISDGGNAKVDHITSDTR